MCQFCNNSFCSGCQGRRNLPNYNPPYTQPFLNSFERPCYPTAGPFPNRCGKPCQPCLQNGCLTETTTNCVTSSNNMNCLGIPAGTKLSDILQVLDAANCCGTWVNLQLTSGVTSTAIGLPLSSTGNSFPYSFSSPAQYLVDGCGNVTLRGFVQQGGMTMTNGAAHSLTTLFDSNINGGLSVAVLPVSLRPKSMVVIPVFMQYMLTVSSSWTTTLGWAFINTDGTIFVGCSIGSVEGTISLKFSLDSIQYSTKQ